MELRHLRYFVTVAEHLNFSRAAAILRMAQPPLSAQIKSLEEELGVKLLERTTRSVRLTSAGRVFLEEARTVLAAASRAEDRAKKAAHGLAGTLRIGVLAPSANAWFAGVLREYRRKFPGVQLALFDLVSSEQLPRLRSGELDAGLLRPPVGFPELDHEFVEEAPQVLAAPSGHPLARKRTLDWRDFHEQDLVLIHPTAQHGYYDPFFAACARTGAVPRAAQYANDIQTKMWLISAGFGIAPTTATLAAVKRPGLVFRPLPAGLPPVQTAVAWRKTDTSPALREFVQLVLRMRTRTTSADENPAGKLSD
jgi:DNA-binding transcriptional LysR family regulator